MKPLTIKLFNPLSLLAVFALFAMPLGAFAAAELQLEGIDTSTIATSSTVTLANGTDFGYVTSGSSKTNTFTIRNIGDADLVIGGYLCFAAEFVPDAVNTTISAGGTHTFDMIYSPVDTGSDTATLTVATGVGNYDFNLEGFSATLSSTSGDYPGGGSLTITGAQDATVTSVIHMSVCR